jgi:hypothetical protein
MVSNKRYGQQVVHSQPRLLEDIDAPASIESQGTQHQEMSQ